MEPEIFDGDIWLHTEKTTRYEILHSEATDTKEKKPTIVYQSLLDRKVYTLLTVDFRKTFTLISRSQSYPGASPFRTSM